MGKNKLQKFSEILSLPNVFENFNPDDTFLTNGTNEQVEIKGRWRSDYFKNDNPIVLELACGRGEYSIGLAEMYPDKNFIGVDIKGARIWKGAKQALDKAYNNVAFLRTRIELITDYFAADEVDEIWIIFPDPFLKRSKSNRRLTSPTFLNQYRTILKSDGLVHLKTDSPQLYQFTLDTIANDDKCNINYQNDNIYASDLAYKELIIKTYYEKSHLEDGRLIKYIQYTI